MGTGIESVHDLLLQQDVAILLSDCSQLDAGECHTTEAGIAVGLSTVLPVKWT